MWVCAHVVEVRGRMCTWKPEVNLELSSSGAIHFVFWNMVFPWDLWLTIRQGWLASEF